MRFNIKKEENFTKICPQFIGGAIYAEVVNSENSEDLWKEIDAFSLKLGSQFTIDSH